MPVILLLGVLTGCTPGESTTDSPFTVEGHRLPELDEAAKAVLLDVAEEALQDFLQGENGFEPRPEFAGVENRVYVIAWQKGSKLYSWWTHGDNLSASVYRATRQVLEHRRPGGARGLQFHVQVLGRDRPWDLGGYQHGLHGFSLRKTRAMNYYGSWAVETNVKEAKLRRRLLERLERADDSALAPALYYFPVLHFARTLGGERVTTFYKGSTPSFDTRVSQTRFRSLRERARLWLEGAVAESGEFRYLFYPSRDEFPAGRNNMIRQLMGSRALAEMAAENPSLLELHRRNLAFMFEHRYREHGDQAYIFYDDKSKLGANAMALRTLVYSPLFDAYRVQARRLVAGILALQSADGSFRPWYVEPDYDYDPQRLLYFYSGEALLALLEYYRSTGDEAVLGAARHSQDFYVRRYADDIEQHYYPAYVPWHTQSLHALYGITGEPRYAEAVFTMTDRLLEIQNTDGTQDPYYRGRFYNPATPQYGSPHSSSDAVYTEGLAYAYELALLENDDARARRYRRALLLGVHNLDNLQYRDERLYFLRRPQIVDGALRIHTTDNKIRVDTTQHALDAFAKIADLADRGLLSFDEDTSVVPGETLAD